ncbi:MAG: hypothetical protein DMF60_02165 [Acidobacteria bacterium]|nr:MAG: hypothetical protein DMF60_02165 [Acidobacteriota bacterium]
MVLDLKSNHQAQTRVYATKDAMKPKHHFWSSLAAGGALYWATGSSASLAGAMIGGFLIDSDHIIDQLWSIRHGAPLRRPVEDRPGRVKTAGMRASLVDRLRPRKLLRLPLIFHSYELLAAVAILTLNLSTPFLFGLLSGYVLHLSLDMMRHQHEFRSPLFYLLSYRLSNGFRRDRLIKPEYL